MASTVIQLGGIEATWSFETGKWDSKDKSIKELLNDTLFDQELDTEVLYIPNMAQAVVDHAAELFGSWLEVISVEQTRADPSEVQ